MLGPTIGELLPSAVGVALSPVPIVAIILMLGTSRARSTGTAFALGWVAGLSIVSVIVVALIGGGSDDGTPSAVVGWLKLVFGALFLALTAKQWASRPRAGETATPPRWMASLDTLSTGRTALLGAALSGANPKNLALTVAAAATIGDGGLSAGGNVVAVAVFVIIGSLTVAGPTIWYLLAPRQAAAPLTAIKDFMSQHNAAIMMVVLVILGAKLIGAGLTVLL